MPKKSRRWDREEDDDPLASMVNLFDLWIVVVVALAISLLRATASQRATEGVEIAEAPNASVPSDMQKLPRFQKANAALTGRGERLGSAYRLETGEVVYVPDDQE